jgi:hypothetical protein
MTTPEGAKELRAMTTDTTSKPAELYTLAEAYKEKKSR